MYIYAIIILLLATCKGDCVLEGLSSFVTLFMDM